MAGSTVYLGTGSDVTFGTSTGIGGAGNYTAEVRGISWSGLNRPTVPTPHMNMDTAPTGKEFGNSTHLQVAAAQGGELTIEVNFNPDYTPPLVPGTVATSETITLQFPLLTGDTIRASWAFSGFCKSFSMSAPNEDIMTATLVCRVQGGVTKVPAS